jgi:hypothetical protein
VRGGRTDDAAWRAGSPAETRPGGACGADACRAHAQTPRRGRGTAAHGGSSAAMRGHTRARDVVPARSRPWSVACAPVPSHDSPKIAIKLQNP